MSIVEFLEDVPEPCNNFVIWSVILVLSIFPEIHYFFIRKTRVKNDLSSNQNTINVRKTRDHEFKFVRIKYLHQIIRYQFVESFQEMFDLRFDILGHLCVTDQLHVFVFVFFRHGYILAVLYQLNRLDGVKFILLVAGSYIVFIINRIIMCIKELPECDVMYQ